MSTANPAHVVNEAPKIDLRQDISFVEKLGYGLGDMACNFIWASVGIFLMYYYTDVIGVSAGVVGTIILVSRFFDGFTDVAMGVLMDKVRSRHGKARPWLLWLALPFSLVAVMVYSVPEVTPFWQLVYIAVTYNLMALLYTAVNIPYGVINSLATQDQYQRSVFNIFRMIFSSMGTLIIGVATIPMVTAFGGGKEGWQLTFMVFSLCAFCFLLITFYTSRERVEPVDKTRDTVPAMEGLKALMYNKYWMLVLVLFIFMFVGNSLSQSANVYYAEHILGDTGLVGLLQIATIVPIMLGMLLVAPVIKRYGKRNTMLIGLVIALLGSLLLLLDPTDMTLVLVSRVIRSIGLVPMAGALFALLADTIEYGEWKTGVRTEGLVYSAGSFGSKLGTGLGIALLGWILSLGSYVGSAEVQAESAIFAINATYVYFPIVLYGVLIALLWVYRLDRLYPTIVAELEKRRAANH